MLPKKIFNYFEIAAQCARSKNDERSFLLGAIGIRGGDKVMVRALNGPSRSPTPEAHAEKRLSKYLTPGSIVYVVRIRIGDGEYGCARPCQSCFAAMMAKGVARVYFSIGPSEYGVLDLRAGMERVKKANSFSVYSEL